MEASLQRIQGTAISSSTVQDKSQHDQDATPVENSIDTHISSSLLYQNNRGIGELDTAEDSIDGMGAIKFTAEEDWGYFGKQDSSRS